VFEHQYDAVCDYLLGDQRLLSQVFLNLLLNGIDAMERGGKLTVLTRTVDRLEMPWRQGLQVADAWIEVQVCDTGRGIEPENRERIFDPFFTTKGTGTGLGLAVAHGIVLEHKGLIDVDSILGSGTCFRILLPLLAVSNGNDDQKKKGAA